MSYQKFLDDWVKCSRERKVNGFPKLSWEEEFALVRDKWIEEKKFKPLIAFIHENWDSGNCDDFSRPFSQYLVSRGELLLFKQLWKGILRHRLENFWNRHYVLKKKQPELSLDFILKIDLNGFNQFSASESLERRVAFDRRFTMEGIMEFINGLKILGDSAEVDRQQRVYATVAKMERPVLPKPTDKRKIDENTFWEIINECRAVADNQSEFLEKLKSVLEQFKPTELKNFDKQLHIKAEELNRWETWALAFIVRRGCGDDEFDYFKAWVVSKGLRAFQIIKNLEEDKLSELFNEDPQLEEIYYLVHNIYEERTLDIMPEPRVKHQKMIGKKWSENSLKVDFPALCRIFNYT